MYNLRLHLMELLENVSPKTAELRTLAYKIILVVLQ